NESDGINQDEGSILEKIEMMTFQEAKESLEKILSEAEPDDIRAIFQLKRKILLLSKKKSKHLSIVSFLVNEIFELFSFEF
ncbi:MAG: hypothetical protein MHPSP_001967, partial [Paramarteilia canceri]